MENIVGSPFADSLVGSALPNEITGLAGVDAVVAQGGADKVDVRDGGPDTASCGTEINTATADQKSVDAVNVDCETVDYLPEPTPTPTNNPTTGGGTTTGTPVGGADGTGPGGPNDRELTFSLAGSRAQRVLRQKAVIVTATCPVETCAVVASATGKLPRVRQRAGAAALTTLALKPVVAQVTAGAHQAPQAPARSGPAQGAQGGGEGAQAREADRHRAGQRCCRQQRHPDAVREGQALGSLDGDATAARGRERDRAARDGLARPAAPAAARPARAASQHDPHLEQREARAEAAADAAAERDPLVRARRTRSRKRSGRNASGSG